MKLGKAIERGERAPLGDEHIFSPELRDALKLLIEAGKELNALRNVLRGLGNSLLPGETED